MEELEDKTIYEGQVIWFSKSFGFASWEKDGAKQADIFLHYSYINADGFKSLKKDQKISFQLGLNHTGKLIAINITPL